MWTLLQAVAHRAPGPGGRGLASSRLTSRSPKGSLLSLQVQESSGSRCPRDSALAQDHENKSQTALTGVQTHPGPFPGAGGVFPSYSTHSAYSGFPASPVGFRHRGTH